MGKQGLFSLKQLATRFDISEQEINRYIAEGLMQPLHLNDGTFFRSRDFLNLEVLIKGADLGLTISEMKEIFSTVSRNL